jgi:hypothetical protein
LFSYLGEKAVKMNELLLLHVQCNC